MIAKSLHTITVLVQVATLELRLKKQTSEDAMSAAMRHLGLNDRPDPYELEAKALKALKASL